MTQLPNITVVICNPQKLDECWKLMERMRSLVEPEGGCRILAPTRVKDKPSYDQFMAQELHKSFDTSHVLVIQLDGYILNPEIWKDSWLQYDYIGAPWFDKHITETRVGNGGFSLRSRRLQYRASLMPWQPLPDDIFLSCELRKADNLAMQVKNGPFTPLLYAPLEVAQQFSIEHFIPERPKGLKTFGFHSLPTLERLQNENKP